VLLFFTPGGDGGWHDVFTWNGDTLAKAPPAPGSPKDLVEDDSLTTVAELVGAEVVDGRLFSWFSTGDTSAPFELRVWTWQLEGQRLVATEVDGTQCRTRPGQYPEPG
jgi:hypothetical protein